MHVRGSEDDFDKQLSGEEHVTCTLDPRKNVPWAKYFEIFGLPMKYKPVRTQILWLRIAASRTTQS